MKDKVQIKKFLGMEVRVVNEEYIILKDMFSALGRLDSSGQITTRDRQNYKRLLEDINRTSASTKCTITSKSNKQKSRDMQDVECLQLDTVPIVLTQFRPSEKKDGSNIEQINTWKKFMIFVDDLLSSLEVYKYIIVDKDKQKSNTQILIDNGGTPVIANKMTNQIMAILTNVYPEIKEIKKDELKIYQSQTTIDLLDVRDFVYSKFINAYEFTGSHSESKDMALKLAKKKYNL